MDPLASTAADPSPTVEVAIGFGGEIAVVDLLRFEEDPEGMAAIPGAVRLDPLEIRRKKRIVIPSDVNLVLYCRSRNSFVSARVAVAMRKHGKSLHCMFLRSDGALCAIR